ncbi:MAG TPA: NERD domain-containing protein [Oligoflexus sp.]|uniref:NERD domain-containing protein n=1 Tax=Oligoflexus sp. TaxID=1971216 RepID=UPI002D588467|nr:NERD domain-containing protein [Oligoflexus sp.]HYX35297.1 NERD domain-containing protein [Oligoflexus sp.]
MARLYPNTDKVRVIFASQAEEQFYQHCKMLSSDWSIYYSCTLTSIEGDQGLTDNEIDFVLYHPRFGLIILEVKGGRISYDPDSQQFHTENRFGERFSIKNPFAQALNWKSRFLRYLKKKNVKLPMTHMVCLPSVHEQDFPDRPDVENMLLIGRQRLENLEEALVNAVTAAQPARFLQFDDVADAVDKILRGSHYTSRLYIRDYIDQHEGKVKDVEHIHDTLISPMVSTKRLAVEGEAGTGKTMLAMALAKHFRDLGQKVLLLSPNPVLNQYMRETVGSRIEVQTYAEFASDFGVDILKRAPDYEGSREDWIQYVGPERLKASILKSSKRFDVLLCDEAQDVQPFWWESIEASLTSPDSHFYIFFDRSQGVFGSGSSEGHFVPEDVLPISTPYFPLVNNYRTTKEISTFSRNFRTGRQILNSHSGRLGYIPELVLYKDSADAQTKLQELITRLCEQEGLRSEELTLLSARRPFQEGSFLQNVQKLGNYDLFDIGHDRKAPRTDRTVAVSTIQAFKGLETSVGIIGNLSEYNMPLTNPIMASLLYVACTRAKHMLYILLQQDDPKKDVIQKAIDAISKRGSLVIGEASHDHLYAGTVSYFNPERLGWLTVDDASLQRSTIMFFPHDLKVIGKDKIEVGIRLSFRVRLEGFAPIATDLKVLDTTLQDSAGKGETIKPDKKPEKEKEKTRKIKPRSSKKTGVA